MRESRKPPSFKRAKPEDSNESSGFLRVVGFVFPLVSYLVLCLSQIGHNIIIYHTSRSNDRLGFIPNACCPVKLIMWSKTGLTNSHRREAER